MDLCSNCEGDWEVWIFDNENKNLPEVSKVPRVRGELK